MAPQQKVVILDDSSTEGVEYSKKTDGDVVTVEEAINLPFTLKDIRSAIPKECFNKSLPISLYYAVRDWAIVFALYHFRESFFEHALIGKLVWWNLVGFWGWCLFVVGHDCGHGSFSNYSLINEVIGHICHAPLCVPFNGWRISHREHHQHHNDIHNDHSWRPYTKTEYTQASRLVAGMARFTPLLLWLYPVYLVMESQECGFSGNHFNPWSPMFKKEERFGAGISALSVFAFLGFLFSNFSISEQIELYWVPYMIFVFWLDLVTYMQHTDEKAIYFRGEAWTYLRGALSTFDRTYRHMIDPLNLGYGRIIDHLHHNISDGHVVHHLFFTSIPHYNLRKATLAVEPVLGKYYRFDPTPLPIALYKSIRNCHFVDDNQNACFYQGADEAKGLMSWFGSSTKEKTQ